MYYSASGNSCTTSLVALENLRHFKLVGSYFGGILNAFIWQDSDDRQETQKQKAEACPAGPKMCYTVLSYQVALDSVTQSIEFEWLQYVALWL